VSRLYQRPQQFISSEMRMSPVYQPVMLAELLKSWGMRFGTPARLQAFFHHRYSTFA
jgi:hypothetical protein